MEKATTALRFPKAPKTVFMIAGITMASGKLISKCYAITSLILFCFVVVSCDEPYVPKEKRLTFTECQEIYVDLQAFVREIYLPSNNSIGSMSEIADNWTDGEIGKKHRHFEEMLDICAVKQFAAKKKEKYIGPNYERSYAALTTIAGSVQAFGAENRAKTSAKVLERRLSLIEAMAMKIAEIYDSQ